MSLQTRLSSLITAIGADIKSLTDSVSNLTLGSLRKRLSSDPTITLSDPTNDTLGTIDILDDASPTAGWPDRIQFRFNGIRTGAFNEYGEIRVDAAKPSTVALRAHGNAGGSTAAIFEVAKQRGGATILQVSDSSPNILVTNDNKDKYGVVINRTDPATSTTDPDIFQVQYLDTRRIWANEKGMLRVGGNGADVRDEDTLKIITDMTPGANSFIIVRSDGTTVMRVGSLGRVNFNMGARLVGDTLEFRDSTDSGTNQTTMQQTAGGNLTINGSGDILVVTPHGNLPLLPVWTGTQAAYDGLTPSDKVLYVIEG